jgi:hypothetical protein
MKGSERKNKSYPLRLPPTMRAELDVAAEDEGISINQFIVIAVAEKIIRHEMQPHAKKKSHSQTAEKKAS